MPESKMSTRAFVVTVQEMKTTLEKVTVFKAVCRSEGPVEPPPRAGGDGKGEREGGGALYLMLTL